MTASCDGGSHGVKLDINYLKLARFGVVTVVLPRTNVFFNVKLGQ